MNCDEVEELIGAYVLDALPEADAAAVREHLAGCPEQAETVADLRRVAVRLPALADSVAPSPELRYRVLGAIARDAQQQRTSATARGARAPLDISATPAAQRPRARDSWLTASWRGWAAVAAVLVVAVAGLLVWNVVLLNRDDAGSNIDQLASRATAVATLHSTSGGDPGLVMYFDDQKKAVVYFPGGANLATDKAYELWQIPPDGTPRGIGVTQPGAGGGVLITVPYDPAQRGAIAVTVERAGGSDAPTSAPIFSTST